MNLKCYQLEINNLVSEILTKNFSRRVLYHDRRDYQNDIMEKVIRQGLVHDEKRGSLKAWVYSIVRNHIIDQERKYQKGSFIIRMTLVIANLLMMVLSSEKRGT